MKTMQRLNGAYRDATVVEFDDSSKFVWLSDSHRGDGSMTDEFIKNKNIFVTAVRHYYDEGFTLIEAGDSDELWEYSARHIIKANGIVFSEIKKFHDEGRLYRMFGNHDFDMADPEFVRANYEQAPNPVTGEVEPFLPGLVVHEAILLRHKESGRELLTVHGHQGDFSNDQNWRFTRFTFRLFWRRMHMLGIKSPSSPIQNSFKRHKVERNYNRWIKHNRVPLICGHTHRERFPRGDDLPYFNTGSCVFPHYITGLELVDGALSLVGWRVEPDANNYLHITKRTLFGPRHINTLYVDPEADIEPTEDLDPGSEGSPEGRSGEGVASEA